VPDVNFVGPFESWRVVVNGHQVPLLSAEIRNGGKVELTLDDRIALTLDVVTADEVIPFIADAIAVAMGYTCHPKDDWDAPKPLPPMKRLRSLYFEDGPAHEST
jgi:hypothetical protein